MAYEDGYDFICLMDDDGRPADKNMMEILVKRAEELYSTNKLLLLNSLVCGSADFFPDRSAGDAGHAGEHATAPPSDPVLG